ncbi:MAG: cytochrome c oxidase subunit 3, partial [Alphaproteobacteria bacterium]
MHDIKIANVAVGGSGLILGFLAVISCVYFWWRDVIFEAVMEKAHSAVARIGFRFGMMLFI